MTVFSAMPSCTAVLAAETPWAQLHQARCQNTAAQLREAGYTAKELMEAGSNAFNRWQSNQDLKRAGYTIEDLKEAGDEDVYRKVKADLEAKGASSDELRTRMRELMVEAKIQVMGEVE